MQTRIIITVGYHADKVNSANFSKGLVTMQNHSCFIAPYTISAVQVSEMDFKQMKLD